MPQRPLIALLTDFGLQDAYVASMKAVILGIAPEATLVDITHAVPPQDIHAGAFLLSTCVDAFARHTTFVCVVDPGVGTDRLPLVLRTPQATFVGPDNGLFSYVLARHAPTGPAPPSMPPPVVSEPVPAGLHARIIANPSVMRTAISDTFHGRDIFAPVAAHLALGHPLDALGPPADVIQAFQAPEPTLLPNGALVGHVVHVDRYGNLITSLRPSRLPVRPVFSIGGATVHGLTTAYQAGEPLIALIGSSSYVEFAVPNGNAAEALGLHRWAPVTVRPG